MANSRVKLVPAEEFAPIQDHDWSPVELAEPLSAMRGVPRGMLYKFLASGQHNYETEMRAERVGGFDLYRESPDDPVRYNKDHYDVYPAQNGMLRIVGPLKDDEHWIDDLPLRYRGAPVIKIGSE